MSKIWLTTDTHFNHSKLIEKGFRPPDFQAQIIKKWNWLIAPTDHVIHLGDVIVGNDHELGRINVMLNGTKSLVRGNHDKRTKTFYRQNGFCEIVDAMVIGHVLLTHEPYQDELPSGCTLNIHGHLHDDNHRRHDYEIKPWHKLLAIELTNYEPVLLHKFAQ